MLKTSQPVCELRPVTASVLVGSSSPARIPVQVLIRGIGPSLGQFGVPNPLADPVLELHGSAGFITITNNNWRDDQEQQIIDTGIPPTNDLESAIVASTPCRFLHRNPERACQRNRRRPG